MGDVLSAEAVAHIDVIGRNMVDSNDEFRADLADLLTKVCDSHETLRAAAQDFLDATVARLGKAMAGTEWDVANKWVQKSRGALRALLAGDQPKEGEQ